MEYLSCEDISFMENVTVETVRKWIRNGYFKAWRSGKNQPWRISKESFLKWRNGVSEDQVSMKEYLENEKRKENPDVTKCPCCFGKMKVVDVRSYGKNGYRVRERECIKCRYKVKTVEIPVNDYQSLFDVLNTLKMNLPR